MLDLFGFVLSRNYTPGPRHYGQPVRLSLGPLLGGAEPAIICTARHRLQFFAANGDARRKSDNGIFTRKANVTANGRLRWASPWAFIISANATQSGCVDVFVRRPGACLLNSRLSVIRSPRNGRWLLFARSNLRSEGGARYVQVAVGSAGAEPGCAGTRFQLLHIAGWSQAPVPQQNIYFFSVRQVRLAHGEMLLGCFPGSSAETIPHSQPPVQDDKVTGGLFCTVSVDGLSCGRPVLMLESALHDSWRSDIHPIDDGWSHRPAAPLEEFTTLALQHGVHVPDFDEREETLQAKMQRLTRHCQHPSSGAPFCENCFHSASPEFAEYRFSPDTRLMLKGGYQHTQHARVTHLAIRIERRS